MARHFAIGDIHGCYHALRTLIESLGLDSSDVVVTLGDYVDRGPNSRDVLDFLIDLDSTFNLVPLLGNHEEMMMKSVRNETERLRWFLSGASETLDSYSNGTGHTAQIEDIPKHHWDFVPDRLVNYFETESDIFVHGMVDPDIPMCDQSLKTLLWSEYSSEFKRHVSGKRVICGHTTQFSGVPASNGNAVCLDTAAYKNGWLSCLNVESGEITQVNEQGDVRKTDVSRLETD